MRPYTAPRDAPLKPGFYALQAYNNYREAYKDAYLPDLSDAEDFLLAFRPGPNGGAWVNGAEYLNYVLQTNIGDDAFAVMCDLDLFEVLDYERYLKQRSGHLHLIPGIFEFDHDRYYIFDLSAIYATN